MSIPKLLDHVVIAGPDLEELVAWFAERTGVQAKPGGAHPTGTANALVALTIDGERGEQYVELIGPDPHRAAAELPATFGIDQLSEPAVVTYAVHPIDLDETVSTARAGGYDPGDIEPLSRTTPEGTTLAWRLSKAQTRTDVPFLIDWGSTAQPGLGELPTIELLAFERVEPAPFASKDALDALALGDGAAEVFEGSPARYRLVVRGADGGAVEF